MGGLALPVEGARGGAAGDEVVPLLDEELEVAVDVRLELGDGLEREGVRDDLALARVLVAVTRVEEASPDGDEGVVEVAGDGCQRLKSMSGGLVIK